MTLDVDPTRFAQAHGEGATVAGVREAGLEVPGRPGDARRGRLTGSPFFCSSHTPGGTRREVFPSVPIEGEPVAVFSRGSLLVASSYATPARPRGLATPPEKPRRKP